MKMQKFTLGLTALNLILLLVTVVQAKTSAPDTVPMIRTQVFELVDEKGQVRSRLSVEADGTVVFRMMDKEGAIRVKLGADKSGSGLVLLDEITEPAIHIVARQKGNAERPATHITLKGADGQRVIEP